MKLVTYAHQGKTRTGALRNDQIVDLNVADASIPTDMLALLQGGDAMLAKAKAAAEAGAATVALSEAKLASPVPCPPKILAVGLNYMAHFNEIPAEVREQRGIRPPPKPLIFNKQVSSVTGPFDDILLPPESAELDYEAELGVVIGKECRRVAKQDIMAVIAGFTIVNDVSMREWQGHSATFTMGKSWDTHCPMGPALVTKDEIADPQNLQVRLTIDGDEKQNFNTGDMIFNIADQIHYLSTAFRLQPGDVIATGTSAGVALFHPDQPWLKAGQVVRIEIQGLGHIENKVSSDPGESYIR